MLRKGAKSFSPCALSTPSLIAMKRTPFCGKIISLIWTRPQNPCGAADNISNQVLDMTAIAV
jgi:hypothetical protein